MSAEPKLAQVTEIVRLWRKGASAAPCMYEIAKMLDEEPPPPVAGRYVALEDKPELSPNCADPEDKSGASVSKRRARAAPRRRR